MKNRITRFIHDHSCLIALLAASVGNGVQYHMGNEQNISQIPMFLALLVIGSCVDGLRQHNLVEFGSPNILRAISGRHS